MAYITINHIKSKKGYTPYLYLCKSERQGKKVIKKYIKYLGKAENLGILKFETVKEIYVRDNYQCKKCGIKEDLVIDHINLLCKGGTNDIENLQVLCTICNQKKGSKV